MNIDDDHIVEDYAKRRIWWIFMADQKADITGKIPFHTDGQLVKPW